MLKKLRAALAKIGKRLNAREDDERIAASKAHRLSREIKRLREELEASVKSHAATLKLADRTGDPQKERKLRDQAEREAQTIHDLVQKIQWKVGKRSAWRKRRKQQQKRIVWWLRRKTTVRKRLKAAKKKWEETHGTPVFESWMLNGCPDNITDKLKPVFAFQVIVCGQYVTATTNGTHTSTSLHYPRNNPDDKGHAGDTGASSVSSMQNAAEKTKEHFGASFFKELFSPCPWWLKYGVQYAGFFPGHGDHGHYGV
jgi:hypothetical protein